MEERLWKSIKVDGRQFGLCPGRLTTDAIFIMRQLQEKLNEKKKTLYHIVRRTHAKSKKGQSQCEQCITKFQNLWLNVVLNIFTKFKIKNI